MTKTHPRDHGESLELLWDYRDAVYDMLKAKDIPTAEHFARAGTIAAVTERMRKLVAASEQGSSPPDNLQLLFSHNASAPHVKARDAGMFVCDRCGENLDIHTSLPMRVETYLAIMSAFIKSHATCPAVEIEVVAKS